MTYWKNGNPTLEFALHTMRLFALGGVEFLNRSQVRAAFNRASIAKQHPGLFESEKEKVESALVRGNVSTRGGSFLPLPEMRRTMRSGHMIAFFRPVLWQTSGKTDELHTDLVLMWPNSNESAAFRFERGFRREDSHGYAHLQFSRSFKSVANGIVDTSLPCWLSDYSLAAPLPAVGFSTWFSMLLSLSGQGQKGNTGLLKVFAGLDDYGKSTSHRKASKVLAQVVRDLLSGEQFVPGTVCSIARNLRLP